MKKAILIILFLVIVPCTAFADVTWGTDLAAAKIESLKTGRPIFVDFFATWCGPCSQMETDTFSDPQVQAVLNKMVCVRLDVDKHPADATSFQIEAIPRTLILPAGGGPSLMDNTGYMGPQDFLAALSTALHLKSQQSLVVENKDLTAVKLALSTNAYSSLKQKNPKSAAAGLHLLVNELGVFDESQVAPIIGMIGNAGNDAIPALIQGMGNSTLAIRAGSYRALQTVLRTDKIQTPLSYDPWENSTRRQQDIHKWTAWWQGKSNQSANHGNA